MLGNSVGLVCDFLLVFMEYDSPFFIYNVGMPRFPKCNFPDFIIDGCHMIDNVYSAHNFAVIVNRRA